MEITKLILEGMRFLFEIRDGIFCKFAKRLNDDI